MELNKMKIKFSFKETKPFLFSFCFGPKTMTTTIWAIMQKQKTFWVTLQKHKSPQLHVIATRTQNF